MLTCNRVCADIINYYAVYCYGWAVLFRGSVILDPIARMCVRECVCVSDNKKPTRVEGKAYHLCW